MSFIALLIVLGVLVFVHELGHFLAAKAVGIQVVRFSIGFGAPILSWRWGETEYRLAWVPLGGYVKMAGLEDEGMAGELEGKVEVPVDPERAFDRKPVWARIVVLSAGVVMNVILAFVLFTLMALQYGVAERAATPVDSVYASELPPGAEAAATLQFGDRIVRVNGDSARSWNAIIEGLFDSTRQDIQLDVAGRAEPLVIRPGDGSIAARTALARAIVFYTPPRIGIVEPGRPAHRAGLQVGDMIVRIDGDTIRSWRELVMRIRSSPEQTVAMEIQRKTAIVKANVTPIKRGAADTIGGGKPGEGMMGATERPDRSYTPVPFGTAVAMAGEQTTSAALAIVRFLARLFSGNEPLRQLGGPVLIGQISGQMLKMGWHDFVAFLAFFSVQLAVLNLLPIPVLDGGHLAFLVVEGVRGRPLPLTLRVRLLNIGFWILIAIMLLAVGNDLIFRVLPG